MSSIPGTHKKKKTALLAYWSFGARDLAQRHKRLPCKQAVVSSIPGTDKKTKNKKTQPGSWVHILPLSCVSVCVCVVHVCVCAPVHTLHTCVQ